MVTREFQRSSGFSGVRKDPHACTNRTGIVKICPRDEDLLLSQESKIASIDARLIARSGRGNGGGEGKANNHASSGCQENSLGILTT